MPGVHNIKPEVDSTSSTLQASHVRTTAACVSVHEGEQPFLLCPNDPSRLNTAVQYSGGVQATNRSN